MTTSLEKTIPSSDPSRQLAATERDRLSELEPIIERGMASFVEVGTALLEISDRRLYRETHSTFAEYCETKWRMTARRAYQLCEAAEVVNALPENVNNCSQSQITNEGQARELAKVEPARRVQVLEAAASTGTLTAASIRTAHVSNNTGENEWYTPPQYIEAALAVMGSIDLDPASCELANRTVKATNFFTKEDCGLDHVWLGNVWLNPPYAQPLIGQFAEKITAEVEFGNAKQACVLVNNATETAWFQRMMEQASAVCFPTGRVRFLDQDGKPGAPLQGQAVLYFGKRRSAFTKAFSQFGFVLFLGEVAP